MSSLSSYSNADVENLEVLQKEFGALAAGYFNEIRDRLTREILLKYQEYCIGPLYVPTALSLSLSLLHVCDDEND